MILSLRGPSGSGKTHTIYELLHKYDPIPHMKPHFSKGTPRQPRAWQIGNLYVIGRYSGAPCSGADGLYPLKDVVLPLVQHYAKLGHVIVEGLVLSSAVSLWTDIAEEFPGEVTLAFMDTPAEKCIAQVYHRNGGKQINEKQLTSHHGTITRQRQRFADMGITTVLIDHTKAYEQVFNLLKEGGWNEPIEA